MKPKILLLCSQVRKRNWEEFERMYEKIIKTEAEIRKITIRNVERINKNQGLPVFLFEETNKINQSC